MKYSLLILSLLLSACGDGHNKEEMKPIAEVAPSPTPKPKECADAPFVGNWIDTRSNALNFLDDCTGTSITQKLEWSLKDNLIHFTSEEVEIDICSYGIGSTGSLLSPISIILNLLCQKSGALSYIKE